MWTDVKAHARVSSGVFRRMVELSPLGVLVVQGGLVRFINEAGQLFFGCGEDAMLGKPFEQYVHKDDRGLLVAVRGEQGQEGLPCGSVVIRIRGKGGRIRHLKLQIEDGEWEDRPASILYLSEKTSEDAGFVAPSGHIPELRRMFDNVPIGMFESTPEGKFIYVNRAIARMLKYSSPEELIETVNRSTIQDVLYVDPSLRPSFVKEVERNGYFWRIYENRYRCRDGSILDAILTFSPFEDESGGKYLCGFVEDVSEKNAALKLLEEKERRYRLIADSMADWIWAMDKNFQFTFVSPSIERGLGYTPQEFLSKSLEELVHPAFHESSRSALLDLIKGRRKTVTRDIRIISRDGEPIWVESKASVVSGDADGDYQIVGVTRDISDRKRAEEAVSKRVLALTRPLNESDAMSIEELFNLQELQKLQDDFAEATGVASLITTPDGAPITAPSNFSRFCNKVVRATEKGLANCMYSDAAIGRYSDHGPRVCRCHSGGLWDAGAAITVGGKHIANWLVGQVRDAEQDEAGIIAYARDIGADPEAAVSAFRELPVMTLERFEDIARALYTLAGQISNMAYQNVQQARFIADVQRAQQAVRESEGKFETVFRLAPTIIILAELETGRIADVNDKFLALSGYNRNEVLGKTAMEIGWLAPEQRERIREDVRRDGYTGPTRVRCRNRFGETIDTIFSGERVRLGNRDYLLSILEDISEYARTEAALRESEERYKALFNSGTDAVFVYPMDYDSPIFTEVNDVACTRLGYSRQELLTMGPFDINPDARASFTKHTWKQTIEKGGFFETRHQARDGRLIPVEISCRKFENQGKTYVLSIARDITARKTAETERQKLSQDYEELFRQMLEGFAVHEFIFDDQGKPVDYRFLSINPAFEEMLGLRAEDILGKTVLELLPGTEPVWIERYANIVLTGEPDCFDNYSKELGKHFLVTGFRNAPGQFATLVTDVTEQKRYEQALVKARSEAEAASRVKSDFLANMSHEVRTPLNGILGMLQLLEDSRLDPEQSELVDAAIQSSRRLTQLLCDILDHSRIEAGSLVLREEPCSLSQLFHQMEDLFRGAAMQKGVSLSFALDHYVPEMLVLDSNRLHQVLGNFVGNAVKYTVAGSIEVEGELTDKGTRKMLRISVRDTGIGIPEEKLDSIFLPFAQVSSGYTRQFEGAGLGLAICRQLADLMGGTILVESSPGVGSCFRLEIPVGVADSVETPDIPAMDERAGLDGCIVLVAEDDKLNRLAMRKILAQAGCVVHTVENGREVLAMLGKQSVDVVLMDIQMPIMDGLAATKAIREGKAGRENTNIPIIALTAYAMAEDETTMLEAGMDAYLSKPVERPSLISMIAKLCGRDTC